MINLGQYKFQVNTLLSDPVITITDINLSGFTINWNNVPDATQYHLNVTSGSTTGTTIYDGDLNGDVFSKVMTELTSNMTYYISLKAFNTLYESRTVIISTSVGKEGEIYNFNNFGHPDDLSFVFRITDSSNNTTPNTGYLLDLSTTSDFSTYVTGYQDKYYAKSDVYGIYNLLPSTKYYMRVRCINKFGTGSTESYTDYETTYANALIADSVYGVDINIAFVTWKYTTNYTPMTILVSTNSAPTTSNSTYQYVNNDPLTIEMLAYPLTPNTKYYYRLYNTSYGYSNTLSFTTTS